MVKELYSQCTHSPSSISDILRKLVRHAYLSGRGALRSGSQRSRALYCIMGHYVFDDQRSQFERQIKMLTSLGQFVSTSNAIEMISGAAPIDGTYFHLSFDDGLECLLRNAAPILDDFDIPTLLFVNSAMASEVSEAERQKWRVATNYASPLRVMNWEQLKATGFEIGAHTRTHRRLTDISYDLGLLQSEIFGCKKEIETALGTSCDYFAWPYGGLKDIDDKSQEAIRAAGFTACFSAVRHKIVPGVTDLFTIPRHHFEPQWPLNHLRYFLT